MFQINVPLYDNLKYPALLVDGCDLVAQGVECRDDHFLVKSSCDEDDALVHDHPEGLQVKSQHVDVSVDAELVQPTHHVLQARVALSDPHLFKLLFKIYYRDESSFFDFLCGTMFSNP